MLQAGKNPLRIRRPTGGKSGRVWVGRTYRMNRWNSQKVFAASGGVKGGVVSCGGTKYKKRGNGQRTRRNNLTLSGAKKLERVQRWGKKYRVYNRSKSFADLGKGAISPTIPKLLGRTVEVDAGRKWGNPMEKRDPKHRATFKKGNIAPG